jgi:hypothetical protein
VPRRVRWLRVAGDQWLISPGDPPYRGSSTGEVGWLVFVRVAYVRLLIHSRSEAGVELELVRLVMRPLHYGTPGAPSGPSRLACKGGAEGFGGDEGDPASPKGE